jgi:hypothetical protein
MTGAAIGKPFAGGLVFDELGIPALTVPNITTHGEAAFMAGRNRISSNGFAWVN